MESGSDMADPKTCGGYETDSGIIITDEASEKNCSFDYKNKFDANHSSACLKMSVSKDDIDDLDKLKEEEGSKKNKMSCKAKTTHGWRKPEIRRQKRILCDSFDEGDDCHKQIFTTANELATRSPPGNFKNDDLTQFNRDFRPANDTMKRFKSLETENLNSNVYFPDPANMPSAQKDNYFKSGSPKPNNHGRRLKFQGSHVSPLNKSDSQNSMRLKDLASLRESIQERSSVSSTECSPLPSLHRFLEKSQSSDKILPSRNSRHRLFQRAQGRVHIPELSEEDRYKFDPDRRESLLSNILITREKRRESSLSDLCNELVSRFAKIH